MPESDDKKGNIQKLSIINPIKKYSLLNRYFFVPLQKNIRSNRWDEFWL